METGGFLGLADQTSLDESVNPSVGDRLKNEDEEILEPAYSKVLAVLAQ